MNRLTNEICFTNGLGGFTTNVSTNDGAFALPGITIDQWGYNTLDVTVRDVSGNTAQQRRTVVKGVTNALEAFQYLLGEK